MPARETRRIPSKRQSRAVFYHFLPLKVTSLKTIQEKLPTQSEHVEGQGSAAVRGQMALDATHRLEIAQTRTRFKSRMARSLLVSDTLWQGWIPL